MLNLVAFHHEREREVKDDGGSGGVLGRGWEDLERLKEDEKRGGEKGGWEGIVPFWTSKGDLEGVSDGGPRSPFEGKILMGEPTRVVEGNLALIPC